MLGGNKHTCVAKLEMLDAMFLLNYRKLKGIHAQDDSLLETAFSTLSEGKSHKKDLLEEANSFYNVSYSFKIFFIPLGQNLDNSFPFQCIDLSYYNIC